MKATCGAASVVSGKEALREQVIVEKFNPEESSTVLE